MGFKKTSRLTAAISTALVFALCFGATAAGAYAAAPPKNPKENTANQPQQPITSTQSPAADGNLTLVTKEYTIDELKTLDISGVVVNALSENVTIARGGNTLKFEYYIQSQNEYTILREDDGGKTRWNLCLSRIAPTETSGSSRSIAVSVPEGFDMTVLSARTDSGDIRFENLVGKLVFAETKSGQINLNGGSKRIG